MSPASRNLLFGSILLFFCCFIVEAQAQNRCYKCASYHVIMHWGRYFTVRNGMEAVVDDKCLNETATHNFVNCRGPCMTLNITGTTKRGEPYVTGVLKGCETNFWKTPHKAEDGQPECEFRDKSYGRRKYRAQFCFCEGNYCNGPKPESSASRSARFHKRPFDRDSAASLSSPLVLLTVLYIFNWL
ncbi:hypothetical protein L596_007747 [Steinernema carpocapsae]|uniref:Protein quiver n=1 Tax=Steinernema carpocapsae TaxID=34508 RepID=A0A4U5PBB3_STECR|nr:hypothetical protein L596_007747 [Steinernema carpocapsae]